jgi:hypothetical protein
MPVIYIAYMQGVHERRSTSIRFVCFIYQNLENEDAVEGAEQYGVEFDRYCARIAGLKYLCARWVLPEMLSCAVMDRF